MVHPTVHHLECRCCRLTSRRVECVCKYGGQCIFHIFADVHDNDGVVDMYSPDCAISVCETAVSV